MRALVIGIFLAGGGLAISTQWPVLGPVAAARAQSPSATAELPKGAFQAPGAWCQTFAHRDLNVFMTELASAYGRGETIVWVQQAEDLEHFNRFIGCHRTV